MNIPLSLKHTLIIVLLLGIGLFISHDCLAQFTVGGAPQAVSLVALLGDPSRYSGQKVMVAGWFHHRFENNALYLTQADADYLIGTNAVWVGFGSKVKCDPTSGQGSKYSSVDGKPVWLVGIFDSSFHGHMNGYSGCIKECESISRIWRPGADRNHVGD